jgi:SAM-dependent methyltransferase
MDEASKTNRIRGDEFKRRYLSGRVIDIGCGTDPVVRHAVPFDLPQGDAQWALDYFEPESFDCVHSSHCLEHMKNVKIALCSWWGLVKPGGYLIIVVPDEDLYEQGIWPSVFNPDHKATFNLRKLKSWSPVSYDIEALVAALPGAEIVYACLQDEGYDRPLMRSSRLSRALFRLGLLRERVFSRVMRTRLSRYRVSVAIHRVNLALDRLERSLGKPFDQTLGAAVAQIQVIAQKQEGSSYLSYLAAASSTR